MVDYWTSCLFVILVLSYLWHHYCELISKALTLWLYICKGCWKYLHVGNVKGGLGVDLVVACWAGTNCMNLPMHVTMQITCPQPLPSPCSLLSTIVQDHPVNLNKLYFRSSGLIPSVIMVGWLLKSCVCESLDVRMGKGGHSTCCYSNQLNTEGGRRKI